MSKGWTAWPRSARWVVGGIVALVLALAVIWILFVPAADWLAHHDVGSATGSLHETALDNARGRLLTLGAGLFAAGALIFTARNFTLSREGQVTDRYTKAIEQLGSDKLEVRIGGIFALERVAHDSARDHPTVMEVLTAFIRAHMQEQRPPPDPRSWEEEPPIPPDVQAALTVVGRRNPNRDIQSIDLTRADLGRADLHGTDLGDAILTEAYLAGADLRGANLTRSTLTRATLDGADLTGANLGGANLGHATLTRAVLAEAHLVGADLGGADLTDATLTRATLGGRDFTWTELGDANLTRANLTRADFGRIHLTRANLTDADLRGANLTDADLARANLVGARWPEDVQLPEGWRIYISSGRLYRAAEAD